VHSTAVLTTVSALPSGSGKDSALALTTSAAGYASARLRSLGSRNTSGSTSTSLGRPLG
jgi:hypothetical protein